MGAKRAARGRGGRRHANARGREDSSQHVEQLVDGWFALGGIIEEAAFWVSSGAVCSVVRAGHPVNHAGS